MLLRSLKPLRPSMRRKLYTDAKDSVWKEGKETNSIPREPRRRTGWSSQLESPLYCLIFEDNVCVCVSNSL